MQTQSALRQLLFILLAATVPDANSRQKRERQRPGVENNNPLHFHSRLDLKGAIPGSRILVAQCVMTL